MPDAAVCRPVEFKNAALVALAPFSVYLVCLPPTVTGEDSGELITAAYTLGIAHPPGYPLWCMLAHLFTYVPLFSIAWRVALMSAVFGALTVALLYLILMRLTSHRWISAAAAMAFGFSSEFWEQAVIAEVYTLNTFFVACCILLLLYWKSTRNDWYLYAFAIAYGLSLCNHTTMQLLGPVFVAFVLLVDTRFWRRLDVYARCTALACTCLIIYAYLPIRSQFNPPVDWGNPENWDNFYAHVTRAQYNFALGENERSLGMLGKQVLAFLKLYAWEFAPWVCWLPALGVVPLWRRDWRAFCLVSVTGAMCSLGLVFLLNFTIDRTSLWLNNVFWIPAYMTAAILSGVGLSWAWGNLPGRLRLVAPALALVLLASPLILNHERNGKSDYYWAHDFAINLFRSIEDDAIYFPTADHATFPLLYYQAVEGMRSDVTIANIYGYPEESVYAGMPESVRWDFGLVPSASQQRYIEDWVIGNTDRPVYFSQYRPAPESLPGSEVRMAGLVYRVVRPGEQWTAEGLWESMTWHTLDEHDSNNELTATMILSDVYFAKGRRLLAAAEAEAGFAEFDRAAAISGGDKATYNNLGSTAVELGYRDEGAQYYLAALEIDPEYLLARRNMAKLFYREGDYANALKEFKAIADSDPKEPTIYFDVADCLIKLERPDDAISVLRAVENRFGKHPRVYRELGFVYLNQKYDQPRAEYYFTQSLLLDGAQPDLQAALGRSPTEEDLRRYYPPGMDIPDEFKKPGGRGSGFVGPVLPTVDIPRPPNPGYGPVPPAGNDSTTPSAGVVPEPGSPPLAPFPGSAPPTPGTVDPAPMVPGAQNPQPITSSTP